MRIRVIECCIAEFGIGEVMRVDVDEQRLARLEQLCNAFHGAIATQSAQLPDQSSLRGDLEHDFRAAK